MTTARGGLHPTIAFQDALTVSELKEECKKQLAQLTIEKKQSLMEEKELTHAKRVLELLFSKDSQKYEQAKKKYAGNYTIGKPEPILKFEDIEHKTDEKKSDKITLTLPDLHGNALKLIDILENQNLLQFSSINDKNRLLEIYGKPTNDLTKKDIQEFSAILARCNIKNAVELRLIGDMLADRGRNDVFMLLVLEQLDKAEIPIEIIPSNHDSIFWYAINLMVLKKRKDYRPLLNSIAPGITDTQERSVVNFLHLYGKHIINDEEIDRWMKIYLPKLNLFSYSIEGESPTFKLFSHAPVGCEAIEGAAKWLNLPYNKDTDKKDMKSLKEKIDEINVEFKKRVATGGILWLCKAASLELDDTGNPSSSNFGSSDDDPQKMHYSLWNRVSDKIRPPAGQFPFEIVHGHSGRKSPATYEVKAQSGKVSGTNIDCYNSFGLLSVSGWASGAADVYSSGPHSIYISCQDGDRYQAYQNALDQQFEEKLKLSEDAFNSELEEAIRSLLDYNIQNMKILRSELQQLAKTLASKNKNKKDKKDNNTISAQQKYNLLTRCEMLLNASEKYLESHPEFYNVYLKQYKEIFECIIIIAFQHRKWGAGIFSNKTESGSALRKLLNEGSDDKPLNPTIKKLLLEEKPKNHIRYRKLRKFAAPAEIESPTEFFKSNQTLENFKNVESRLNKLEKDMGTAENEPPRVLQFPL